MRSAPSRRSAPAVPAPSARCSTGLTSTATSTTTRATTATSTRATTVSRRRRPRYTTAAAATLAVIVGWTTFGFAGVYPSTLGVPALLCLLLAATCRPWSYAGQPVPRLHVCLGIFIAATAAQLLLLPPVILDVISPAARPIVTQLSLAVPPWLPITIDARATGGALLIEPALAALFLAALRIFAFGGVRLFARSVSMIGLLLSLIAMAQDSTAHGLMYWRWKPLMEGGSPFGPFVNRNHFATWAVLALPLPLGYLAAHSGAHRARTAPPTTTLGHRIVTFFDGRAILLAAAACMMMVALVSTLSRSGLLGLAAAGATAIVLRLRHGGASDGRVSWWLAAAVAIAAVMIVSAMPLARISARLSQAHVSAADRMLIWKDTLPMVRDFWLTG